jgi:hypothetical protein
MDMDDLVACIEAEDDHDENEYAEEDCNDDIEVDLVKNKVISEDEMELDEEERAREKELSLMPVAEIAKDRSKLTYFFDESFINQYAAQFNDRVAELSKKDIPYWKV